jgi:large subunit ribosomal protein L15
VFAAGANVDVEALRDRGLIKGVFDRLKILGNGTLSKSVTVWAHAFSKSAAIKIKEAGGKALLLQTKKKGEDTRRGSSAAAAR